MVGGRSHVEVSDAGARPALIRGVRRTAAPAVAGVVGTALIALVTLFNLDQVTSRALAHDAFQLAAASSFLAAATFRLTRFERTGERHTLMTAIAFGVLAVLATPVANLTSQVVPGRFESPTGLVVRGVGAALVLVLLRTAVATGGPTGVRRTPRRMALAAAVVAVALGGLVVLVSLGLTRVLEDHTTYQLSVAPFTHVLFEVSLTTGWLSLGLLAARSDGTRPWAQRLGPLLVSLGVVELLRSLGHMRDGWWDLAATALLASAAMIAAHMAYVDMVEAGGFATEPTTLQPGDRMPLPPVADDLGDLDVAALVTGVVERFRNRGLEIRLRQGGAGDARGRAQDLVVALEALLTNAAQHAAASPVDVHVVAISERVEVSVIDRGPGLSAATAESVLSGAAAEGRGGLALARQLMQRNGGDLALRNRIGGATFLLVLPTQDVARRTPHRGTAKAAHATHGRVERRVHVRA